MDMDNGEVTWSSVEMYHRDCNTTWFIGKDGIPRYKFG